ncbi:MAG: DNA polymerase Y family protein [Sphingobium sp.]
MTQPPSAKPGRRYLAVHLPWLAAQNALIRTAAPPDAPFAIIEKQRGALRIVALDPGAVALGLTPGLPLADARARVPDLAAVPAEPEADAALLARLAVAARAYTPSVSVDPPQGLLLDIAGATHFFADGEVGLAADLTARLAAWGLEARTACADTPDAARALARFGAREVRALPVEALEIGADAHLALKRSGFRRIGELADLPRAPLAARFGTGLPLSLARLLGEEDRHITPAPVVEPVAAILRFAEPIGRAEDVLDAVEALLADLGSELERRGEGGRAFALELHRSDGHVARLLVETGAPTRDAEMVLRLLRERIESLADPLDPGFGYDSIGLAVPLTEMLGLRQGALEKEAVGGALGPLLDRLAVRYGRESVLRFVPGDSHVPERAAWLAAVGETRWTLTAEVGEPPLRPFTLFDPPQRVEVLAAVPDGPPRRFRWRGGSHDIVRQEGPERIAPEWWLRRGGYGDNPGLTRDYYRVEDKGGRRFWLFRHGFYGEAAANPHWYLHGVFV